MIKYIRVYGLEFFLDDDVRKWLTDKSIKWKNIEPKNFIDIPRPLYPTFDLKQVLLYTKNINIFSDKDYIQKENFIKMAKKLIFN